MNGYGGASAPDRRKGGRKVKAAEARGLPRPAASKRVQRMNGDLEDVC